MASSHLTKLNIIAASNRLLMKQAINVVLNIHRPAAASSAVSYRLFSSSGDGAANNKKGIQRDGSGECIFKFKNNGSYTSDVPDVFNTYFMYTHIYHGQRDSTNAICPRLSAIRNMNRLLHLMDVRVDCGRIEFSRWDVMEDAEALYLVRNISSWPVKKVNNLVYNSPTGLTTVYGTAFRVSRKTPLSRSIEMTVGRPDGYHPNGFYPAYTAKICLPPSLFTVSGIKMDVERKVFKMTIPKVEGKWVRSITVQINLHSTIDDPIYYQYDHTSIADHPSSSSIPPPPP